MPQGEAYTIRRRFIPWYPAGSPLGDLPLGRHWVWDSRSLAYPYQRRLTGQALAAVLHDRRIPILDQDVPKPLGSCTGNAEVGALGTDPLYETLTPVMVAGLNESGAVSLYSAAETIDGDGPYPPNDNGSSGPSVCQAAKDAGLISGYTHVTDMASMQDAIQHQGVIVGSNWYDSMDSVSSSGIVTISPGASVRGGHEYLVRGDDPAAQEFYADNSWSAAWGLAGSFRIPYGVMDRLLAEQGDCTVSVPLSQPAPVPVVAADPDTELWQSVEGWVAEPREREDLIKLQAALRKWAGLHHYYGAS